MAHRGDVNRGSRDGLAQPLRKRVGEAQQEHAFALAGEPAGGLPRQQGLAGAGAAFHQQVQIALDHPDGPRLLLVEPGALRLLDTAAGSQT